MLSLDHTKLHTRAENDLNEMETGLNEDFVDNKALRHIDQDDKTECFVRQFDYSLEYVTVGHAEKIQRQVVDCYWTPSS